MLAATNPLPLSSLDGNIGFRITGVDANDFAGSSVSGAGDVNGDGFDDLIIGADRADDSLAGRDAGAIYVVFGKPGGDAPTLDLSTLDGTDGFRVTGAYANDRLGNSVSGAGDVNGDGFDDLIIGAPGASGPPDLYSLGKDTRGKSYVVFGKSSSFLPVLSVRNLNATDGFLITGIDEQDYSGFSVSGAGDLNGDGFDDLIIGALGAEDFSGNDAEGESYVVFGKSARFGPWLDLSTLNGVNGFRISGVDKNDNSGRSVSGAGDVNGDGFDDLLIGASTAESLSSISSAGESYVVFGGSSGFDAVLDLSTLDGTVGFRITGIDAFDHSGSVVSGAGDVNGDGFDDLLIGASDAEGSFGKNAEGESYVVFGSSAGFSSSLDLRTLNGIIGFRVTGIDELDGSGGSVSAAGDINGDGYDDLVIGASRAEDASGGTNAGESYVLFGHSGGFASALDLSTLNGLDGFRITGIAAYDYSGYSVSGAGDVNGDGFQDLFIGATGADGPPGSSAEGASYVVFGGNFTGGVETHVGTSASETVLARQGASAVDVLIGGRGNDMLISDGGSDVLRGGEGDDVLAIPDVNFAGTRRLLGGNGIDTVMLDESELTFDLTTVNDNRIIDVEAIELGSDAGHTLVLNALEARNLSSHSKHCNCPRKRQSREVY